MRRARSCGTGWIRGSGCRFRREYRANTAKTTFLAYGGWWEDKTGVRNDNDFNNNGLVSADRVPHPGLYAIKYVYRYLHARAVDLTAGQNSREELVRLHQPEGPGAGQRGK